MSLMGADNALLARATAAAVDRGVVVVAAAGNDGPSGPPSFPAAYAGVIGVGAVDRRGRAYGGGNRGAHVDFAAPGVEVWAAGPDRGGAYWTGTSFAAPFVAAAAAWAIHDGAARDAAGVERALRAGAVDLGAPGRDPVFGWGLATVTPACGG
jgi:subtilisin family serine protease